MTCLKIIEAYLKEHGYDGLCYFECGCGLDDLAPCNDGPNPDCEPAYRVKGKEGDIYVPLEELKKNYVEPEEND